MISKAWRRLGSASAGFEPQWAQWGVRRSLTQRDRPTGAASSLFFDRWRRRLGQRIRVVVLDKLALAFRIDWPVTVTFRPGDVGPLARFTDGEPSL